MNHRYHLVTCIDEINCWMSVNRFKLNIDITQFILFGNRCLGMAAPVAWVTRRTSIRSAPRAVEWEAPATGLQRTVSRSSGQDARRLTRLTIANEGVPSESGSQLGRVQ